MKKTASLILVICLLVTLACPAASAEGLDSFKQVNTYAAGQFSDVEPGAWYESSVIAAYELGLMKGQPDGTFNSAGGLSIAEAITMAARLHSIYHTGSESFVQGTPWYQVYVDYALANGIISGDYGDYSTKATRAQYAVILAGALPASALEAVNAVDEGMIPDVTSSASYAPQVYKLYRAGVLTGNDSVGTFTPNAGIERCQAAAILSRMARVSMRRSVTLTAGTPLTAEALFLKCSPAVFYIEVSDSDGWVLGSGSGFFISADGTAVTNYHVIEGAAYAVIRTTDGNSYDVLGWSAIDEANDLAILKIDGSGFPHLELGDSRSVSTGATVYAIGSPLGLENTLSQGIISSRERPVDGVTYIQTTAAISPGSSGGALLNVQGQAIGVTSAYFEDGQNLNLAVPIHMIEGMNRDGYTPLSDLTGEMYTTPCCLTLYVGQSAAVDVTEMTDVDKYFTYYFPDEEGYMTADTSYIVSCTWGEWYDYYTCPLTVTATAPGYVSIEIDCAADSDGSYLNSTYLTVAVLPSPSVLKYYPGSFVPTYESVTGTPLKDTSTVEGMYISTYAYDGDLMSLYDSQLLEQGWETVDFFFLTEDDYDFSYEFQYMRGDQLVGLRFIHDYAYETNNEIQVILY